MPSKPSDNLEETIKDIVSKMSGLDPKEIPLDAHFVKDLGIDSIQGIELVVAIKKLLGIDIDDMKLPELITVNAVCKEIRRLQKEQSDG